MDKEEEYSFIKEKIKDKPLNKKRLFTQAAFNIGSAAVFGLVACIVFYGFSPVMKDVFQKEEPGTVMIPKDENPTGVEGDTPPGATTEPATTPGDVVPPVVTETIVEKVELKIEDYEKLCGDFTSLSEKAKKSLVTVSGVNSDVDVFQSTYETEGTASGLIIADNDVELLILTEESIVKSAQEIRVTFCNGVRRTAVAKKYDVNTGLAIIAVNLEDIPEGTMEALEFAELGNSNSLTEGTPVIAVGMPLGYESTIVSGNITSLQMKSDTTDVTYDLIETDMLGSNKGSGILINTEGTVVGVIAQRVCTNEDHSTVTALAISDTKGLIERLSNNKGIAFLGIQGKDITEAESKEYNVPTGIGITNLTIDSPAMEAGIQSGDVIIGIGGQEIKTIEKLREYLVQCEPEQLITITAMRKSNEGYKEVTFDVTLRVMQ